MPAILARIGKDRYFLGAILLFLFLIATASPFPLSSPGPDESPRSENYGRVLNLEEAPALSAFLLRGLTIILLTIFLSGLAINLQGLARREWRVFSPGEPPGVPWGVGPVVKLVVYFIALFLLLLRLEKVFLGLAGISPETIESWLLLGNAFLQFALLLALANWFLRQYHSRPGYGLLAGIFSPRWSGEWIRRGRQALRGYICFFPLLVILGFLAWGITWIFGLPWQSHPLVEPLLKEGRPALIFPLLIAGVIFAPLAEEVFFRGLLFPALAKRVGVFWSSAVTAALFATLHFNWFGWLPIFGLGVLLAWSYQRTGSLLVPVFIHAFHNALFLAFTILAYQAT
jgi:uncharacterized protein